MNKLNRLKKYSEFSATIIGDIGIAYLLFVLFFRGDINPIELIIAFGTLFFRVVASTINVIEIYK